MAETEETIRLSDNVISGEERIKTSLSFKKGIIAGLLIVLLVFCIGVLVGYGIGQYIATDHYAALLNECQNNCLRLSLA